MQAVDGLCLDSELLKCFVTKELMRWPGIEAIYGPTLRESSVFSANIVEGEADDGTKRWNALHQRVIEHVSASNSRHR